MSKGLGPSGLPPPETSTEQMLLNELSLFCSGTVTCGELFSLRSVKAKFEPRLEKMFSRRILVFSIKLHI